MGASGTGREGVCSVVGLTLPPVAPALRCACSHPAHLSDLLEALGRHAGEDVALGLAEDLEGHGTVVVLQGRDVIVADGQLRAGVDLVPGVGGESRRALGHPHSEAPSSQGSSAGGGWGVYGGRKGWRGPHSARAGDSLLPALLAPPSRYLQAVPALTVDIPKRPQRPPVTGPQNGQAPCKRFQYVEEDQLLWARPLAGLCSGTSSECELRGWVPTGTPPLRGTNVHTLESALVLTNDGMLLGQTWRHRPPSNIRYANTRIR